MSDELASRLRKLNDARDAEVIDEEVYQASLVKLRGQYGVDTVDALLRQGVPPAEPRSHTQHIAGYATIAAAVAGDVHGDVYIVGERPETTKALLAGYLRWLAGQCGQLPLRGVREQKAHRSCSRCDDEECGGRQIGSRIENEKQDQRPARADDSAERAYIRHDQQQRRCAVEDHVLQISVRSVRLLGEVEQAVANTSGNCADAVRLPVRRQCWHLFP